MWGLCVFLVACLERIGIGESHKQKTGRIAKFILTQSQK